MPRQPSDAAIHRRAVVAFHRAQALGRNPEYRADLLALRAAGWHFGRDGIEHPALEVFDPTLRARAKAIRERAGLMRLVMPKRLRALTVRKIWKSYAHAPLFDDVPGWTVELMPRGQKPRPGAQRVPDLTGPPGSVGWVVMRPVPMRRLRQRHRLSIYPEVWRVNDLWHELRDAGHDERSRERRIIEEVWPGNWRPRPFRAEKAPIHQRVYDYMEIASEIIEEAYRPKRKRSRKRRD